MARNKKSPRKKAGNAQEKATLTPMQALVNRECFESVILSFQELEKSGKGLFSGKKAFAAILETIGSKVQGIDRNWIRAFVRLLEKKEVLLRQTTEGKSKSAMLKLGDTTFKAVRRNRRTRKNGNGTVESKVPVAQKKDRSAKSKAVPSDSVGKADPMAIVPLIDQKIENLEAELAKLKQARELLS